MDLGDAVVWNQVERGSYPQKPPDYGTSVPSLRSYHVVTEVASIDGGDVTFSNQHAFDSQLRVLYEKNLPFSTLPVSLSRLQAPTQQRPTLTYLSNTWSTNFYHWMCLTLPLLRYYEAAGLPVGEVYVGERVTEWQKRSLELVGIPESSIVTEPTHAEVANIAISTRYGGAVAPEAIEWTRNKMIPSEPSKGTRRLFLGRGQTTTRRLIDEERLADAMAREYSFEFVTTSDMTLDEEIKLFAEADVVVSAYGAALTNLLFAPRGTRILELRAYDADFAAASAFTELSCALDHEHGVLRGLPTHQGKREISTDVKVDEHDLLTTVESMLEGRA